MTTQTGTPGNDTLYRGKGVNHIQGGAGYDTFSVAGALSTYTLRVDAQTGDLLLSQGWGDEIRLSSVEALRFGSVEVSAALAMEKLDHLSADGHRLIGGEHGSRLKGSTDLGIQTLQGNGGDDYLYGGKGVEAAAFRGLSSEYRVEHDLATGLYRVRDLVEGRDGVDVVVGIGTLEFADGRFDLTALAQEVGERPPAMAPVDIITGTIDQLGIITIATTSSDDAVLEAGEVFNGGLLFGATGEHLEPFREPTGKADLLERPSECDLWGRLNLSTVYIGSEPFYDPDTILWMGVDPTLPCPEF